MTEKQDTQAALAKVDQWRDDLEIELHAMGIDDPAEIEEVASNIARALKFAPWAKGSDAESNMTAQEVKDTIMRSTQMGINPFNRYEAQIWKSKGTITVDYAYTLLVEWMEQARGQHTRPRYRVLGDEEKAARGLNPQDIAVECTFWHVETKLRYHKAIQEGVFEEDDFIIRGVGAANAKEVGSFYFSPKGRDPMFKAEKRALVDAIRHAYGTPVPAEIQTVRQRTGWDVYADAPRELSAADLQAGRQALYADDPELKAEALPAPQPARGRNKLFKTEGPPAWATTYEAPAPEIADGEVVDLSDVYTGEDPDPLPEPTLGQQVCERLRAQVGEKIAADPATGESEASQNRLGLAMGKLTEALGGNTEDRHQVLEFLFAVDSGKELNAAQVSTLLDWLIDSETSSKDDKYPLRASAASEARALHSAALTELGQQTLLIEETE